MAEITGNAEEMWEGIACRTTRETINVLCEKFQRRFETIPAKTVVPR